MQTSRDRILTRQVDSLPPLADRQASLTARERGEAIDEAAFDVRLAAAGGARWRVIAKSAATRQPRRIDEA